MATITYDDEQSKPSGTIVYDDEQPESNGNTLDAISHRLFQDETYGWGDKAVGAIAKAVTPQKNADFIDAQIAKERNASDQLFKKHPILTSAMDVAAYGLNPLNKFLPANPIAAGATAGGIAGAGNAEGGLSDTIIGGLKGAALGGGVGAGVGMLTSPIKTYQGVKRMLTGEGGDVGQLISSGIGKTKQAIQDTIDKLRGGQNIDLVDVNPQMHNLAEQAAKSNPEVAQDLSKTLETRKATTTQRLGKSFDENVSNTTAKDFETLMGDKRAQAAPIYEQSYGVDLQNSALQKGEQGYKDYINIQNQVNLLKQKFPSLLKDTELATSKVGANGEPVSFDPNKGVYNTEDLHNIMQTLWDKSQSYKNAGDFKLANRIGEIRKEISTSLKNINPQFGAAQDAAGDYLSMKKAYDLGGEILGEATAPNMARETWSKLDANEKEAFLSGLRNQFLDKAGKGVNVTGNINQILSPNGVKVLNTVLGDKAPNFIKSLQAEQAANFTFAKLFNKLYGVQKQGAEGGSFDLTSIPSTIRSGYQMVKNRATGIKVGNAPQLNKFLTDKNAAIDLLERLKSQNNFQPKEVQNLVDYIRKYNGVGTSLYQLEGNNNQK